MTLTACGGGGGSSGGGNPVTPPKLGQATDELREFGITEFSVEPRPASFTFSWINPSGNPTAIINNYTVNATVYSSATGSAIVGKLSRNIDYTDNNTRQDYTYTTGIIPGFYYEFFATANYANGDSSKEIRLFNGRLFAGPNIDGDGLADRQDPDDDNDGVNDSADNCPTIFNSGQGNLGDAEGATQELGDVCDGFNDFDNDGAVDQDDIDADGDGLIEAHNADALNAIRYNLNGTGLDLTGDDDNQSGGESSSCGGSVDAGGELITVCSGYELMGDIDLAAAGYSNWQPIGNCNDVNCISPVSFSATFEGNGYSIDNLVININNDADGIGLFGAAANSEFHNIHLTNVNISAPPSTQIGGLLGRGSEVIINSSSVSGSQIIGRSRVGGLIGLLNANSIVSASSVSVNNIRGVNAGGIAGESISGLNVTVISSMAIIDKLTGVAADNRIGGLIGDNLDGVIISSIAIVSYLMGSGSNERIGGLSGDGSRGIVNSSIAIINKATISGFFGGILGIADNNRINLSYSIINMIDAPNGIIGGLVGGGNSGTGITASYWDDGISFVNATPAEDALDADAARSSDQLRSPTTFTGIYELWANAYCNPATGEYMESATALTAPFIRAWHLGTANEYPALTCLRDITPAQQRAVAAAALAGRSPVAEYRRLRAAE